MTLRPYALCTLTALLLAAPTLAQERPVGEQIDRRLLEFKEALTDQMHELFERRRHEPLKYLGKTLKLEFALEPVDKDSQKMWITVATSTYGLNAQHKTEAMGFSFQVDGRVALMDNAPQQVGLTFHTALKYHQANKDNKVDARMQTEGSAVVPIGKRTPLAQLGEKTLVVLITEMK